MKKINYLTIVGLLACTTITRAATFTVINTASDGAGSFSAAIRSVNASGPGANTIDFNIPSAGAVQYILPPVGGFPLIYHDNTTIDGTTQTGYAKNTAAITSCNNSAIKIALDASNGNFRDMAYVWYGHPGAPASDPVIDNYNDGGFGDGGEANLNHNAERGGYDPETDPTGVDPYEIGEKAILGIYRSTNVTVKGIAFLSSGGEGYGLALAQDFGRDPTVRDRLAYDNGTCRGFHLAGCVFGIDPGTGAGGDGLSQNAIAAFRHRDWSGATARRPVNDGTPDNDTMPNGDSFIIGVAPGSADPRAEFNVLKCTELAIAAEAIHIRVSGNTFNNPPEVGRSSDASDTPSILYGTDGDGVNDADEGNLFDNSVLLISQYGTQNKLFAYAGNSFGIDCTGARTASFNNVVDEFRFDQGTRVRFGSDFNGVGDAAEANKVADTLLFAYNPTAPNNNAWINARGNSFINNSSVPPLGDASAASEGLNVYDKFINAPIVPVITGITATSLTGTCGTPVGSPYTQLIVDVYGSDPEGDAAGNPQGLTYRGSFVDNGPLDSNPAVGAFTANITGFGVAAGSTNTIAVTYAKGAKITSVSHNLGACTTTIGYPLGNYTLQSATSPSGPWTTVGAVSGTSTVTPGCNPITIFRLVSSIGSQGGGQTSPAAVSVVAAP